MERLDDDAECADNVCEECGREMEYDSDLISYEDVMVCEHCFDKLRRLDEVGYQELEMEDFNEYEA